MYQRNELTPMQATVIMVILTLACIATALWFIPVREKTMSVRSMEWTYMVEELEDYWQYVCQKEEYKDSDGKTKEREVCGNQRRTRVTNRWWASGTYPEPPHYPAYEIRPGRYSRQWPGHTVVFSDDGELYYYSTSSLEDYNRFRPRAKYRVGVNIYGVAIRAA